MQFDPDAAKLLGFTLSSQITNPFVLNVFKFPHLNIWRTQVPLNCLDCQSKRCAQKISGIGNNANKMEKRELKVMIETRFHQRVRKGTQNTH